MKQTILMVHNYYQIPGGEDTVVANEKKMLEDNGHKVVLYTRNNSELKDMGILRKLLLPFTTIYNPRTAKDIKKIIKKEKIDIVHVHNTLNLISPAVYYATLKMKKPVVQTVHNFRLLCPGATFYRDGHICEDCVSKGLGCALKHKCYRESFLQTLACVLSTKIHRLTGIYGKINYICLTQFNKEKLLQLKEINKDRVFVKPNIVNKGECNFIPYNKRENKIVYAGRLEEIKGTKLLIKAWRNVRETVLELYGDGPLKEWCQDYIKKYNMTNVLLGGYINNKDLLDTLAKSKALILPTQVYEGFPMTIAEAFSVSTPVLCTNIGNAASLIENGYTGFKFDNDETSLCNAVKDLEDSENMYSNVRKVFENLYSEQSNYLLIKTIYDGVTK